jgi:hypothetical protein
MRSFMKSQKIKKKKEVEADLIKYIHFLGYKTKE